MSCSYPYVFTATFLSLAVTQFVLISSDPEPVAPTSAARTKSELIKGMLNYCIDSQNHKRTPGPEDDLHHQCAPWKGRACCTSTTSVAAHYSNMYDFDWDHCVHVAPLSDKCRRHFVQDLCFYECSPNVGPWKVQIDQKFRRERFMDVPLCAADCDAWFNDCYNDYTCIANWSLGFDWEANVTNKCPAGSSCKRFSQVYNNSREFCETVWDHSWKYTSNDDYCMRLWFNGSKGNPNDKVAKWKAHKLVKGISAAQSIDEQLTLLKLILPLLLILIVRLI